MGEFIMSDASSEDFEKILHSVPFIANLLRMELVSLGQGTRESALIVQPYFLRQHGCVHAGVRATLADHTMAAAAPRKRVAPSQSRGWARSSRVSKASA